MNILNLCFAAKGERSGQDTEHLDFKVMAEPKDCPPYTVILVASSRQEKSAWTSDISQVRTGQNNPVRQGLYRIYRNVNINLLFVIQCIDNIRCNGLMMNAFEENSKVTVPQMIK